MPCVDITAAASLTSLVYERVLGGVVEPFVARGKKRLLLFYVITSVELAIVKNTH